MNLTLHAILGGTMLTTALAGAAAPRLAFPGSAWETSSPEAQGMDAADLARAMDELKAFVGRDGVDETLVVRNGTVVWQGASVTNRHLVWSCTKSFMSSCLGLLWDDGRCAPADLAARHYPELAAKYPAVTLEHLATFTSGYAHGATPLDIADPAYAPGEAFCYSSQSDLLAALLTRVAGRSLDALFRERIAGPIGIGADDMRWGTFAAWNGIPVNGGTGRPGTAVEIHALALARFGWLLCNGGVWNGRRLLSTRYVEYATVPRTSPRTPPHDPKGWYVDLPGNYGLNWWTNGPRPDGAPHWPHAPARTFAAQGNRNNVCFIIPDWQMVVVRLGNDDIIDMRLYDRMFDWLGRSLGQPR